MENTSTIVQHSFTSRAQSRLESEVENLCEAFDEVAVKELLLQELYNYDSETFRLLKYLKGCINRAENTLGYRSSIEELAAAAYQRSGRKAEFTERTFLFVAQSIGSKWQRDPENPVRVIRIRRRTTWSKSVWNRIHD